MSPPEDKTHYAGKPMAKMPKNRVFEKQFVILLAVVIVAGLNTFWVNQLLTDGVHNTDKILHNQDVNGKKVQDFMAEQRQKDRATGLEWVIYINAVTLDNEKVLDEIAKQLHININDTIVTNGTHVLYGNHSLPLKDGIPFIDLNK